MWWSGLGLIHREPNVCPMLTIHFKLSSWNEHVWFLQALMMISVCGLEMIQKRKQSSPRFYSSNNIMMYKQSGLWRRQEGVWNLTFRKGIMSSSHSHELDARSRDKRHTTGGKEVFPLYTYSNGSHKLIDRGRKREWIISNPLLFSLLLFFFYKHTFFLLPFIQL